MRRFAIFGRISLGKMSCCDSPDGGTRERDRELSTDTDPLKHVSYTRSHVNVENFRCYILCIQLLTKHSIQKYFYSGSRTTKFYYADKNLGKPQTHINSYTESEQSWIAHMK